MARYWWNVVAVLGMAIVPALVPTMGLAQTDPAKPLTRIAFGSCANQDKPLPIYEKIADAKPELLLLLGDTIYADLERSRKVTTEVIQEKYETLAKLPGWQRLKATCPMLATWDDHDYGKNDAGVEWPLKDESQRIFHDFFGTPADSPRRTQKGVYSATTFGPVGKRTQIILLDTRYFRSKLKSGSPQTIAPYGLIRTPYVPNTDADATMLGDDQWKWLETQLKEPADLRLLCSSIQVVSEEHPFEKWGNMPAERNRLFKLIQDTGASGVVILSGDRHLGELSLTTSAIGYPLYDITSSGLNQGAPKWREQEKNKHRVSSMPYGDHFGFITIDWSDEPTVSLQLRDDQGEITLRQKFPISLLQAKDKPKDAEPPKEQPKLPPGVLTPAEAIKKVGEVVTVQYVVKGGRAVNDGKRILLNSDADFRSKENFTVVLNEKGMTDKHEKATYDTFKDKTIRAKGKVTVYKDSPQIQIDEAKDLEIIEVKK